MAEHSCTRLRVEYLESPLGLGVSAPRFSWRMDTTEPGVVQTGYEIEVREASSGLLLWGGRNAVTQARLFISSMAVRLCHRTAFTTGALGHGPR